MRISSVLFGVLAQLSSCAGSLCPPVIFERFHEQPVRLSRGGVDEIAPLADDDFLIVTAPPRAPLSTELTRVRHGNEESIADTPSLSPYSPSPSLVVRDGQWWFSRQGHRGGESNVYFVRSDGKETRVKIPRRYLLTWLPIATDEPRGLEVSVVDEQPALRIAEITPSGAKEVAAFEWWETGYHHTVAVGHWSAEALADGRFAVVALDGPSDALSLRLRLIAPSRGSESEIPCDVPIDDQLATAVDPSGRLAVVGVSRERQVVALLVDVNHPRSTRCRVLDDHTAQPPFGTPAVVWSGDRFVAAWIRDDGIVRACELSEHPAPIIDVGRDADVELPLRQLLFADGETVIFVWKQRGGYAVRRMPRNLSGYAFAAELWTRICDWTESSSARR